MATVLAGATLGSFPADAADAPQHVTTATAPAIGDRPLNWRTVLVAGDDSVPAFDNGVDALSEAFGERGVNDIVELRASSGDATADSIGAAIEGIQAGDGDGCLVYLTSHGSEDGLLLSNDGAGNLEDLLSPDELAAILDQGCGRAPTVLIVSACHSGTFLTDGMSKPNRVVITAARTDRTSFGCSDDNEFTFFDQCMIGGIPMADDWETLYDDVNGCVEEMESELEYTPSLPQIFEGPAVDVLALPESLATWLKAHG